MNLFIGPNGSGKSNVIRILGDLSVDYEQVQAAASRGFNQGEPPQNALLSTARLSKSFISKGIPHSSYPHGSDHLVRPEYSGDLKIEYNGYQQIHSQGRIQWKKNFPKVLEFKNAGFIRGTLSDWTGRSNFKIVTSNWDDLSFTGSLNGQGDWYQDYGILIFGIRYIFQRNFIVGDGGFFDELHSEVAGRGKKGSGGGGFDRKLWPDGVLRVAKVIQQLRLRQTSSVALLEEPEIGLEPRVIRRFVEFLLWLGTAQSEGTIVPTYPKRVEDAWQLHVADLQASRKEPVNMGKRNPIQYFLTSHSSVMLSKILELSDLASVYEFSSVWEDSSYYHADSTSPGAGQRVIHSKGEFINQSTLWSNVRKVQTKPQDTLSALGASGADLLQCNGVVWVEGPSDVIYIKAWLDMYARESGTETLVQGHHFEFQMYGGAILDSLCLQSNERLAGYQNSKLVEMFSFSRNAYVVLDSDAVKSANSNVIDKSNFAKAKEFIKSQFNQLSSQGFQLGLWYPEGDIKLTTIEDYLDNQSLQIGKSASKKVAAEKRTQNWAVTEKKLSDFPEAKVEVEKLHSMILGWQP